MNDIVDILNELIKYKTVYPNYEEVDNCFNYIKSLFNSLYIKEFSNNDDKSLFISNTKDKKLDILFVGHIDVVAASDKDFIPKIIDNKLYGRGSFDMKGHDAVMISLLKNNKFEKKVGLLLTSDEERGGFNGTKVFLEKYKYRAKIAIVPDAGNRFNVIEEEKGVLQLKVIIPGKSSHASTPYNGDNAIIKAYELYNYLINIYKQPSSDKEFKTSINLAKIEGGDSLNKVPNSCICYYDIRHIHNDSKEDIINNIKRFNNKIKVEVIARGEEFITLKDNEYYEKFINNLSKILNKKVVFSKCNSASDGRFFFKYNIPCILMNASGGNIHSNNEFIKIDSLYKMYEIFLRYIERL